MSAQEMTKQPSATLVANSQSIATTSSQLSDKVGSLFFKYTIPSLLLLFTLGITAIFAYINHQQNLLIHSITQQEEKLYQEITNNNLSKQTTQQARSLLTESIFNEAREGLQETFIILSTSLGLFLLFTILVVRKLKVNAKQLETFASRLKLMNNELQKEMVERDKASTQLEELNKELKYLSMHDALTKLPNRRLFEDRLNSTISTARRNKSTFAVMFLDLDGFKLINDSLGHDFGDELLIEVSQRLTDSIRQSETVARLGGDEFAFILTPLDKPESAALVASRILKTLEAPVTIKGQQLHVNSSIGITIYPLDSDSGQMLLKNADIAMYHAKSLGRGNFQFYREEMNIMGKRELLLRNDFDIALKNSQLAVFYQPIVDIETRSITRFEALLRWKHPELGDVPPLEIIKLANNLGLNVKLGDWIIETICKQLKAWQDTNINLPEICVNLSILEIEAENFVGKLTTLLETNQIAPNKIIVELTESAFSADKAEKLAAILKELNEKDIKIAIDDFGAGYFPLNYFCFFPLNILKIDRSFIKKLQENDQDGIAVVRTILALAASFHLEVIAEGVETKEQMQILKSLGCIKMQGFLFSKALPATECLNIAINI